MSIFKLLFIILFFYVIYNLFKLVFFFGRSIGDTKRKFSNMGRSSTFENRKRKNSAVDPETGEEGKIIELDKDQYKVE